MGLGGAGFRRSGCRGVLSAAGLAVNWEDGLMQAMNGSGAARARRFCCLLGSLAALVALAAMSVPSIAAAGTAKDLKLQPIKNTYLALGDSLAFGYSEE